MDLALHFPCVYPLIKQGIRRAKSANHLLVRGSRVNRFRILDLELNEFRQIADTHSPTFVLQNPRIEQSVSRTRINGDRRIWLQEKASMGKSKKGSVCCKKPSKSNGDPSKSNQEEIISLLKRIQSSISKGESRGLEEKESLDESSENKPLTKAILDVLEKSRKKTKGDTRVKEEPPKRQVKVSRQPSSFPKRTPIPSALATRGKFPATNSNKALGELTDKEEKASLIDTMKLAELKEVAKKRGIKGYSKLKKSELLELLRSY